MGSPAEPALRLWLRRSVHAVGRLYSPGPRNAAEGVEVCRALDRHGISATLGQFGIVGDDPTRAVQEYCLASATYVAACPGVSHYLSLKPPVLQFDLRHSTTIASAALANGHGVLFDSHGHDLADATLHLLERLMLQDLPEGDRAMGWRFGLALPSRWKRSQADARWAMERGVRVRLVKGEFRAGSARDEIDPRGGFLALVDQLAGNVPGLGVATHDRDLAREAIARCRDAGTAVQLELLFGIPAPDMMALAREAAVPIRYYVPFGDTLLVYGIRHFLTHPRKLLRPGARGLLSSHRSKIERIAAFAAT
jgi:proline dehydrogenase